MEENAGAAVEDDGFDERFLAWLRDEQATRVFFLVEVDGVAVGMANIKRYHRMPAPGRDAGEWGYVGNVFVLAPHRDGGVGSVLMQGLHAWAKEHDLAHLRLAPSPRAWPFYERLGYAGGTVVELDP